MIVSNHDAKFGVSNAAEGDSSVERHVHSKVHRKDNLETLSTNTSTEHGQAPDICTKHCLVVHSIEISPLRKTVCSSVVLLKPTEAKKDLLQTCC